MNKASTSQLRVRSFDISKLFLVFIIITLWVGVNGVLDEILNLLFVNATVYIKLGYYTLLTIFGTVCVYSLDISPALIM